MFEVSAKFSFSSAHYLRDYPGKCSALHGHNWKVTVAVRGENTGSDGMLLDFGDLKKMMRVVEGELDHRSLNDVGEFAGMNPTAENIARYIFRRIGAMIASSGRAGVSVARVSVFETENCEAVYYE